MGANYAARPELARVGGWCPQLAPLAGGGKFRLRREKKTLHISPARRGPTQGSEPEPEPETEAEPESQPEPAGAEDEISAESGGYAAQSHAKFFAA